MMNDFEEKKALLYIANGLSNKNYVKRNVEHIVKWIVNDGQNFCEYKFGDAENYDDDLKLRVWNEIVDMIRNNAQEFCEVSSQSEISSLLDSIKSNSSNIKNTFLQESVSSLMENIETTKTKIHSVKVDTVG